MAIKLAERPPFPNRHFEVEFPLLDALSACDDGEVVAPGQFSQQCCEFWQVAIGLEKLRHSPQIARRESTCIGELAADMVGQRRDRSLPPAIFGDPPTDVLTDGPIQVDQGGIGGGGDADTGGLDEGKNMVKVALLNERRSDPLDDRLGPGRAGRLAHAGSRDRASSFARS
ncbi:MAG TPA: hypothetical protein VHX68_10180 [Planctomycetaceae bacterium]|nr:hypothetical protein [Planctomycetaceae bacterium]